MKIVLFWTNSVSKLTMDNGREIWLTRCWCLFRAGSRAQLVPSWSSSPASLRPSQVLDHSSIAWWVELSAGFRGSRDSTVSGSPSTLSQMNRDPLIGYPSWNSHSQLESCIEHIGTYLSRLCCWIGRYTSCYERHSLMRRYQEAALLHHRPALSMLEHMDRMSVSLSRMSHLSRSSH